MNRGRNTAAQRLIFYTAIGLPLAASLYYILAVSTDWARLSSPEVALSNLLQFIPPNIDVIPKLLEPTLDTMLIAFFATLIIAIVSLPVIWLRSEEHTSELQSLMRIS